MIDRVLMATEFLKAAYQLVDAACQLIELLHRFGMPNFF